MSRRGPVSIGPHRRSNDLHYQNSTNFPQTHLNGHVHQKYQNSGRWSHHDHIKQPSTTIDIGYSDETTDTYYDYYEDSFQHSPLRESRNTDFSDESGSTRLPYFEFDESNKRYSERSIRHMKNREPKKSGDCRKVYPNQEEQWDRLYHEIQTPCDNVSIPTSSMQRRLPSSVSRMSDRPQSSMSSGMTNAMVYGCGGKCQTFENVCYFFLQLVFTMGILVGASLCIAGVALRRSAARNLQVLVYIGALLALVSTLLLGVQCNARSSARKRRRAAQAAKRAPIPMEVIQAVGGLRTSSSGTHATMVVGRESMRSQLPQVHPSHVRPLPQRPCTASSIEEEQGIPWWRRKDLNPR